MKVPGIYDQKEAPGCDITQTWGDPSPHGQAGVT